MRVLVDTNVFLDVLLDRSGLAHGSGRLLDWCQAHPRRGWISWHTLSNIYYIGSKLCDRESTLHHIDQILSVCSLAPVKEDSAQLARGLQLSDFEDAMQVACALPLGARYIITRNERDFKQSPVPAITPEAFLPIADGARGEGA